jgi:ion channel-forming bestrophin family protein
LKRVVSMTKIQEKPSTHEALAIDFWRDALAIQGSITPDVVPNVIVVGVISAILCFSIVQIEKNYGIRLAVEIGPYEILGAALGLVLVLRTNAGYDRWWEARKLWGGIVNQSRNLAIACLCYGPKDLDWQKKIITWTAALPHLTRLSLRAQKPDSKVVALLGKEASDKIADAVHMPSQAAFEIAKILRQAYDAKNMDSFAFLEADKERALLIDHVGACERILSTPLATAYSIKIRRFIALFLLTLPFPLIHSLGSPWLVPIISMLAAYPLLSFDALGVELQNPFSTSNLSHLPLDAISDRIERDVTALLQEFANESTALPASNGEIIS